VLEVGLITSVAQELGDAWSLGLLPGHSDSNASLLSGISFLSDTWVGSKSWKTAFHTGSLLVLPTGCGQERNHAKVLGCGNRICGHVGKEQSL
jgi:hypothetical protein